LAANKKFELWWNNYLAVKKVDKCCRDAWDAATEAAEARFTSHNSAIMQSLCDSCQKVVDCHFNYGHGISAIKCNNYVGCSGTACDARNVVFNHGGSM